MCDPGTDQAAAGGGGGGKEESLQVTIQQALVAHEEDPVRAEQMAVPLPTPYRHRDICRLHETAAGQELGPARLSRTWTEDSVRDVQVKPEFSELWGHARAPEATLLSGEDGEKMGTAGTEGRGWRPGRGEAGGTAERLGELRAQESLDGCVDIPSCGNQGLQVGLAVDEAHGVELFQLLLEPHFRCLHLEGTGLMRRARAHPGPPRI